MLFRAALIIVAVSTVTPVYAQSACPDAPVRLDEKSPILQKSLEAALRNRGWGKYLDKGQLGVALVDLSAPGHTYYAGLNDDTMMYAASLPKIAILLTVVEAVDVGQLEWSRPLAARMKNMIVASSNRDASWGVDRVGLDAIEETLRDPRYCLYDETHGGLWVGRAFRRGGPSNRDPVFNVSHGATARQAARFYTMLDEKKLVTPRWSRRMLRLMAPPKHHHKFVAGLKDRPGVRFLARKSGTWRDYHADSALIEHDGRRYIAIGLSQHLRRGAAVITELAAILDDLVMTGTHRRGPQT